MTKLKNLILFGSEENTVSKISNYFLLIAIVLLSSLTAFSQAPIISSSSNVTGAVGMVFNYTITASNTPTSFNATSLPAGLSVNTTTGIISGTPTTSGNYAVTLTATNGTGSVNQPLTVTVIPAWSLTGNPGTNSGTNFLGTTDNTGLQFSTNSLPRMFISSAGNVGIGNITPAYPLDVNGTVRAQTSLLVGTSSGVGIQSGADGNSYPLQFINNGHSGGYGGGYTFYGGANTGGNYDNGVVMLRVYSQGPLDQNDAVGIGNIPDNAMQNSGTTRLAVQGRLPAGSEVAYESAINAFTNGSTYSYATGRTFGIMLGAANNGIYPTATSATSYGAFIGYQVHPLNNGWGTSLTFSAKNDPGTMTEIMRVQGRTGSVGIGTTQNNPSALLDLTSTTLGFLMPRLTTTQKTAIATPAEGLQVYDNTLHQVSYYNGSSWVGIAAGTSGSGWGLTGNLGTTASNFIGTASGNNNPVLIDVNGTTAANFGITNNIGLLNSTSSNYYTVAMGYQTTASGWGSTSMGNLTIANGGQSIALGNVTTAGGFASLAAGNQTNAIGNQSAAMGNLTTASGFAAVATGNQTTASGNQSAAMGNLTTATQFTSFAIGNNTAATGQSAFVMGEGTVAPSYCETVIGSFNATYTPASNTVFNAADRIFSIGNGTTASALSNALTILKNGKTGLGTVTPTEILDVVGNVKFSGALMPNNTAGTAGQVLTSSGPGIAPTWAPANAAFAGTTNYVAKFTPTGTVIGTSQIFDDGTLVGIGTTSSASTAGYKFAVNGSAIFTKIVVKLYSTWPDFVFDNNYKLPSLTEIKKYIDQNKHLPGLPSADEVGENGIDIGSTQTALLQKVEELTLYIIDQDKEIDELKAEKYQIEQQKNQIDQQKDQMDRLQQEVNELKTLIKKTN